jgi:DNA invertase Pin-like site-specific DNA recombinase
MIVGYARTSTGEQVAGFDAQVRDLQAAGAEKIFAEQVSSMAERAKLAECLRFLREGDELVVTKPDRLARSTVQLLETVESLLGRGVRMRILSMGADFTTPTGKLILGVLGSIAQFERELMLERQREGIAKAKQDGKYQGRPASWDDATAQQAAAMRAAGKMPTEIGRELGVSRDSVYRMLQAIGTTAP